MSSNDKRDNPDGQPDETEPQALPDSAAPAEEPKTDDIEATDAVTPDDGTPADDASQEAEAESATEDTLDATAEAADSDKAESQDPWSAENTAEDRPVGDPAEGSSSDVTADSTDTAETASDTPPQQPVPPAEQKKGGGGFVPGLFGGLAAAGIGFGAAQFLDVDWLKLRGGEDPVAAQLAEQNSAISGQSQSIATLESQLQELSNAVASPDLSSMEKTISDLASQVESEVGSLSSGIVTQLGQVTETLSGLSDAIGAIETRLDGVDGTLSDLDGGLQGVTDGLSTVEDSLSGVDDRLVAVEKRPLVESSETAKATFDAYEREVQRLTDELSSQQEESAATAKRMAELAALTEQQITTVQEEAAARLAAMQAEASSQIDATQAQTDAKLEEAQSTVQSAAVTAALVSLEKSLEEGTPYADALATLSDSTDVPEALSAHADTGVQTLMQLRDSFPAAARAGLAASIRATSTEADPVGKLTAFFRHQTGIRSLAPKEGEDADAVLSRAEAAADSGDLPTALTEIGGLPEAGQTAMADWTAAATARVNAVDGAGTLVASLATN